MTITESIRELRKRLGDTQPEFGARFGLSISVVPRYEAGDKPSGAVLAQMAVLANEMDWQDIVESLNAATVRRLEMYARSMIRHVLPLIGQMESDFIKGDRESFFKNAASAREQIDNVQLNPFANRPRERQPKSETNETHAIHHART